MPVPRVVPRVVPRRCCRALAIRLLAVAKLAAAPRPPVSGSADDGISALTAFRNLAFTVVVRGLGGALVPWRILTSHGHAPSPAAWEAVPVIAAGTALYAWCVWNFAAVGRGTPGPWDAPRCVVAAGPYRWVRNPIYIAALLIVLGEAWLFMSLPLLKYASAMAIFFHLFVVGYEEPALARHFGSTYLACRRTVPRWIPSLPRHGQGLASWLTALAPHQDKHTTRRIDGINSELSR